MAYSSELHVQHQECYDTLVGQDRFSGVLVKIVAELLYLFSSNLARN